MGFSVNFVIGNSWEAATSLDEGAALPTPDIRYPKSIATRTSNATPAASDVNARAFSAAATCDLSNQRIGRERQTRAVHLPLIVTHRRASSALMERLMSSHHLFQLRRIQRNFRKANWRKTLHRDVSISVWIAAERDGTPRRGSLLIAKPYRFYSLRPRCEGDPRTQHLPGPRCE